MLRISDRVVIAWSKSRDDLNDNPTQYNNDIVYIVSENGGQTWSDEVNITNFIPPDLDCASGDTLICDMDTFRTYTDLSVILDNNDDIHIAFTTVHYYSLEGTISRFSSQIWHWGSDMGYMTPIFAHTAAYFDTNWATDLGDWQYTLQRPNLAIDDETGEALLLFRARGFGQLVRRRRAHAGHLDLQVVERRRSLDDGAQRDEHEYRPIYAAGPEHARTRRLTRDRSHLERRREVLAHVLRSRSGCWRRGGQQPDRRTDVESRALSADSG
ncbi:MAG: exo-alpha-sialidase [bacterium]|nr:exo-alpha-sialidase [bacterium]